MTRTRKTIAAPLSAVLAVLGLVGLYSGVVLGWPAAALALSAAVLLLSGVSAIWLWAIGPAPAVEFSWCDQPDAAADVEHEQAAGVSGAPLTRIKFDWARFELAFRAYAQAQE